MKVIVAHTNQTRTTVVNVALVDFNTTGTTGVVVRSIKGRLLAGVVRSERSDRPDVPIKPYLHQLELENVKFVQVMEDDQ